MTEKKKLTPEEEQVIRDHAETALTQAVVQYSDEEITAVATDIFKKQGVDITVVVCDSPRACEELAKKQESYYSDMQRLWSIWYQSYVNLYESCQMINLEINEELLEEMRQWVQKCPFMLFNTETVYVSRNPVEIHKNDANQLSNEDGMSCKFPDGWGIYTINGVSVNEQIVMKPETQTIKQIRDEQNEEVKRIRIERYGWDSYLTEIGAEKVDERKNDIEGTLEFLFRAEDDMMALMCICPSTRKEFVLEVPPDTKTCQEAQAWLSGGLSNRIISAS